MAALALAAPAGAQASATADADALAADLGCRPDVCIGSRAGVDPTTGLLAINEFAGPKRNVIVVSGSASRYTITDSAGVLAQAGCEPIDRQTVRCSGVRDAAIAPGEHDDTVTVTATDLGGTVSLGDGLALDHLDDVGDTVEVRGGTWTLRGDSGRDKLVASGTAAVMNADGGPGDDELRFALQRGALTYVHGGLGNDLIDIARLEGATEIDGDAGSNDENHYGHDTIRIGTETVRSTVRISGGWGGHERISVGTGDDVEITTGWGHSVISGSSGRDVIYGGIGSDTITGGKGKDELRGLWGNDTFYAQDNEVDAVYCGASDFDNDVAWLDRADKVSGYCHRHYTDPPRALLATPEGLPTP